MARLLHELLLHSAERVPDRPAVLCKDERLTFEQIAHASQTLAGVLRNEGIRKGDRVAFWLEKRFEKVISIFGISVAGGVMVPIKRLSHVNQAAYIINNCGAKLLITTAARFKELATELAGMSTLTTILIIDSGSTTEGVVGHSIRLIDWTEALGSRAESGRISDRIVENDLAAILYTSGSTGRPKGVALSHCNIVSGTKIVCEYLGIHENDRLLSVLSFGFDYGLNQLTTSIFCGAKIVLLDHLFSKDLIHAVQKYEITGLAAVAATWLQLLQIPWDGEQLPSLRYITNSGGAIPENYVRELRKRLPKTSIFLMYGLTEAFRSTYLDPRLVDSKPASIGKAIPGNEILVLNEHDQPVGPGQIGELVHRGPVVAQGYWGDPELTAARYRRNPMQPKEIPIPEMVVYSGDYVKKDEEGFLYFVGRKDEMIKCAGNRISPTEVEEVLYATGKIQDAVVMGLPHEIYGEIIKAVVAPRPQTSITMDELLSHCRKMLPPYMIPHDLEIRSELPRNANGKLDRAAIRKQILEGLGLQKRVD